VVLLGTACTAPMSDRVADLPSDSSAVAAAAVGEPDATSRTTAAADAEARDSSRQRGPGPRATTPTARPATSKGVTTAPAGAAGDASRVAEPAPTPTTPIELTYERVAADSVVTATVSTADAGADARAVATAVIDPGETYTFEDLAPGTYTVTVEERSAVVAEPDVGHAWSFLTRTDPVVIDDTVDPIVIACATNERCSAAEPTTAT
jgi:hypothetical protein